MFSFGAYELDDEAGRVDLDAVWEFLSTQAYWGRFRMWSGITGHPRRPPAHPDNSNKR